MADKKISQLTDGTSLQSGDFVVVARSGDNFKVDPTQFGSSIDVTGSVTADGADLDGAVVINESGADVDFRVESDTNTHALFVQGSDGFVGIGTSTPSSELELRSGSPKITFTDNPTGRYGEIDTSDGDIYLNADAGNSSGGSSIRFSVDASECMRIDDSGNVGIGTTSPNALLSLGTATPQIQFIDTVNPSAYSRILGTSSGSLYISADEGDAASNTSIIFEVDTAEAMRIDDSGNVGIGTTSPEATLNVVSSSASATTYPIRITNAANPSADVGVALEFGLVTTNDSRGSIGCHWTGASNSDGTYLSFAPNDGSTGNVERMRIDSDGNVGIGTSSPDGTLHVFAENNYNGTDFVDAPHALLDNGTITNHTAVLVFNSSGVSEANKKSGITGGNYFNELHGLGLFGDISGKDRSATPDVFINDSGNVGIGTSSPAYPLDVRTTVSTIAGFYGDNALLLVQNKSTGVLTLNGGGTGDSFAFETAGSEAMRITSSGILLVGTTDTTNTTLGCKIAVDGTTIVHTDASGFSQPLLLNRQDSDGTLLTFRQANSTVGTIGSESGVRSYIVLDPRTAGAGITAASSKIQPTNQTGSPTDATIDIGEGSYRWKDLYLSGGVYLGGTGAANLLDDYEEGTFTPVLTGSTSGTLNGTGVYTKVGNKVTIFITFTVTTGTKPTGDYSITGLPFTSKTTSPDATIFNVATARVTFDSAKTLRAAVGQNSSVISISEETSNAVGPAVTDANFVNGSNMFFRVNGTYLAA